MGETQVIQLKLRGIHSGTQTETRLMSTERVDRVSVSGRKMQYLYQEAAGYVDPSLTIEHPQGFATGDLSYRVVDPAIDPARVESLGIGDSHRDPFLRLRQEGEQGIRARSVHDGDVLTQPERVELVDPVVVVEVHQHVRSLIGRPRNRVDGPGLVALPSVRDLRPGTDGRRAVTSVLNNGEGPTCPELAIQADRGAALKEGRKTSSTPRCPPRRPTWMMRSTVFRA